MFRNTNTHFYYIFTDEITLITYFSRADYREHIVCENTIFKSTIRLHNLKYLALVTFLPKVCSS